MHFSMSIEIFSNFFFYKVSNYTKIWDWEHTFIFFFLMCVGEGDIFNRFYITNICGSKISHVDQIHF